MHRYYCSYFDRNYLIRALALIGSLQQHQPGGFTFFAVCLDEEAESILGHLQLPNVVIVPFRTIEEGDERLLATKQQRTLVEYYWTSTPTVILRVLERHPHVDILTYMDADLFFFASPELLYSELGTASALIHEHRYSPNLVHLEAVSGRFNVGLLCFRRTSAGFEILRWWRDRCLEWCYNRYEDGKFGDQLYLNDWPTRFEQVAVIKHPGAGVAPWNQDRYAYSRDAAGKPLIDRQPLIFFHFHSLTFVRPDVILPVKSMNFVFSHDILTHCFVPYLDALQRSVGEVRGVIPNFSAGLYSAPSEDECRLVLASVDARREAPETLPPHPAIRLNERWWCFPSAQMRDFLAVSIATVLAAPGVHATWGMRQLATLLKNQAISNLRTWRNYLRTQLRRSSSP